MALVELRRAVQRRLCDHTGSRCRPERGAAQPVVGVLQLLDRLGVPPDHDVGVGAQPGDVVDARGRRRPRCGELVEQLLDLGASPLRPVARRSGRGQPEHRPHRVADGVVDLADLAGCRRWAHGLILPAVARGPQVGQRRLGRRAPGRDAGRDADAVVRRAADRQPGDGRDQRRGSGPPGRGGRRRTAAARRPSAARGCRRGGREARARRDRSASATATSSSSGAGGPPPRGAGRPRCAAASRSGRRRPRTQAHLAKEKVDALIVRPSTGGTRKPEPRQRRQARPRKRERHDRHRGVVDLGEPGGRPRRRRRPAAGRQGLPGTARMTASTRVCSGAGTGPLTSRHP